jgi:hypothetical protein
MNNSSRFLKSVVMICLLTIIIPVTNAQNDPGDKFPQLLFKKFIPGTIMLKSGKSTTANLNYNTVEEEMLFEQGVNYMVINKLEDVDTIVIDNRKFVPVGAAFYEVITNGKLSLYIQHKNRFAPVPGKTAYGMSSPTLGPSAINTVRGAGRQVRTLELPDNVTISAATVYWARVDKEMIKFTTERQFLKILPGKEDQVKAFIKRNDIDIKSPEKLWALGNFCNRLIIDELMK